MRSGKILAFIASDMAAVKESLGGIGNHLEIMLRKIDDLPEEVCNAIHREFEVFNAQISGLSEQMEDWEERLARSIDSLKGAILDNLLLKGIIDEAAAEIDGRFRDRLSKDAKESIVTAWFTLNFYKKISKEQTPLIEYSGVVILAATALEIELRNRLYAPFGDYVKARYGQKNLKAWYRQPFTLGSFDFVVDIEPDSKEWGQNKQAGR